MFRYFFAAKLAAVTCVFASAFNVRADNAPKKMDLSYVSSKSFFAVYLQPRKVLAGKRTAPKFFDRGMDSLQEMTGIDIRNLNEVIIQGRQPEGREFDDDDLVVILRCEKPGGGTAIRDELEATVEAEFQGKKYFKSTRRSRPAIYFADDRTFVIAAPEQLEQILAEKDAASPLIRRLKKLGGADAAFVMNVKPIRDEVVADIERDRSPGPHKAFGIDLFQQIDTITVEANLDQDVPLTVVLETKDGSGEKVEGVAKGLLTFLKTSYKNERDQIKSQAEIMPLAKVAVDVFDKTLAGAKIKRKDDRVLVSVEAKGGLPDAMDVLLGFFMMGGGAELERSDPGPSRPPRIERSAPTESAIP